jgi:hypothetical protein
MMEELTSWYSTIYWIDYILFFLLTIPVAYLTLFALASLKKSRIKYPQAKKKYRYAIFIPAKLSDDEVILDSVSSFTKQTYPRENLDIIVITNDLKEATIQGLKDLGVIVLERPQGKKDRKGALEFALSNLDSNAFDAAIIVKPNDSVDPDYLEEINKAFYSGGMVIQTHRRTKKIKSNISILSAISEEINNSIFRRGHVNLGFSSALIGSGMVFNYEWLRQNITKVKGPGLTKQLESLLLRQGIFIEYIETVYTYDNEKKKVSTYNKQKRDWYKSQRYTLKRALSDFPKALFSGNFDFCDKIFQWMIPSKIMLPVYIILFALLLPFVDWTLSIKWWILFGILILSYSLSIPEKYISLRSFWALLMLPFILIFTIFNKIYSRFFK